MPTCDELATKAELQELRDQLNAVLGEKEDGTKVDLFVKGASNPLIQAGAGLTLLGMAKTNAPKVITDIILEGGTNAANLLHVDFAKGNAVLKSVTGKGTTNNLVHLNKVSKVAGQSGQVARTATQVGGTSAGGVMLLANLTQIAGTLALSKATVDIFDYRINQEAAGTQLQLDAQQASMLRMYENNKNDFNAINAEIAQGKIIASQNRDNLQLVKNDLLGLNLEVGTFNSKLEDAQLQINQLQTENAEHVARVNELTEELSDTKADLTNQINTVNLQLEEATKIITSQALEIEKMNERMTLYEQRVTEVETRIAEYENRVAEVEAGFVDLRADLDLIKELNPGLITERPTVEEQDYDKVTYYETAEQTYERLWEKHNTGSANRKEWSSIVQLELQSEVTERLTRYEIQAKSRGFNATPTAQTQTGVLELAKTLADPDAGALLDGLPTTVTEEDVRSNPQGFKDRLAEFLEWIKPGDQMTPQQIEILKTSVSAEVGTIVGASILPKLDNLTNLVSFPNISRATEDAICRSVNGQSSCSLPGVANPTRGLKGLTDNLEAKLGAASLVAELNITRIVSKIDNTVHHKDWGLEKIQGFTSTAWKATHADKILNGITTALVLHNAVMLSGNLAQTIGEAASGVLSAIGIKDSEGEAFDVNAVVKAKMTELISSVLGSANYEALTKKIAAANRIYQSTANVLDLTRSLFDSARNVAELTAENTGKIGNALRESGAVYEDAYELMQEKVNPQNQAMRRLEGLTNTLGNIAEGASAISEISSEVVETRENITQLKAERKQLADETKLFLDAKKIEKEDVKTESQAATELAKLDFAKDEGDD
jgi:hypothetical protein